MVGKLGCALVGIGFLIAVAYGVYWYFTPRPSDGPVTATYDLDRLCFGAGGQRYFLEADAYGGSPPHPIAMFRNGPLGLTEVAVAGPGVPAQWSGHELDPKRTQLVLCMGKPKDGGSLRTCEFSGDSLALHRGVYDATLYEAKTRREIASGKLEGSAKESCPGLVAVEQNTAKLFTEPDYAEIRKVFGEYVDG